MKRLLTVTLLLFGIALLASCNSYDVEGKPEIASNPAKMVFAYYPWDDGSEPAEPTEEPTEEPTTDTEPVVDDADNVEPDDTEIVSDEDNEPVADEDAPAADEDANETEDEDASAAIEEETPVYVRTVKAAVEDVITEEFEIYNRGVTGELKIRKINMIDPNGQIIAELENETYKKLFQLEVQKVDEKGIVTEGYNAKGLTFDYLGENKADAIASLCPLQDNVCKKGFDADKYNAKFKIRISYNKDAATDLKDNPPTERLDNDVLKYRQNGEFSIEICTNDPTKGKTDTCGDSSTSYRIQITRQPNKPPKPIIHVAFESPVATPMSYRNIYDKVQMNLKKTCVSDPDDPDSCLEKWESKYYIKYKWEMKESPTPLIEESKLKLSDMDASAGQWIAYQDGRDDPRRADFKGLMITPRRYPEKNEYFKSMQNCEEMCGEKEPSDDPNNPDPYFFLTLSKYLLCHQKYCEEYRTKYYKINIQAETVDKETDLVSDTADITVVPKIIPQARVVAQLTWKQGFKTKAEAESGNKEGAAIDLDVHLVKKSSLEAKDDPSMVIKEGLLGTRERSDDTSFVGLEEYYRHDDCSFSDKGQAGVKEGRTIQWHASLDIDNTWGGNNYETPETIGLGPIEDILDNATGQKTEDRNNDGIPDGDGIPDVPVIDDQYLVVVGYVNCTSNYSDDKQYADNHGYTEDFEGRCDKRYDGDDKVYEIDARVEILIDGEDAGADRKAGTESSNPRPADSYAKTTKDFKIKVNEWKVVAAIKWNNSWKGPDSNPKYPGNALVTDVKNTEEGIDIDPINHPVCTYDMSSAVLIPIWDAETYKNHITAVNDGLQIGTCN